MGFRGDKMINKFIKLSKNRGSMQIIKHPNENKYSVIVWNNYGRADYMTGLRTGGNTPFYHSKEDALKIGKYIKLGKW